MKPISLVQYQILEERILSDWIGQHGRFPDLVEFTRELARVAPEGLGRVLNTPLDNLSEAMKVLWWNYLFLEHGLSSLRKSWEEQVRSLSASIGSYRSRLQHLERKVQAFALREPEVSYTFYDTFLSVEFIDSTSDVLVDTQAGEVRLLPSAVQLLADKFRVVRDGTGIVLRSDGPVLVNGVQISVRGSVVITISQTTPTGSSEVFRSIQSGESLIEFPPAEVMELRISATGNGTIESAIPFARRYRTDGKLLSKELSLTTQIRDKLGSFVRLSFKADIPDHTTLTPYIRWVDQSGNKTEWQIANKLVPIPQTRVLTEITSWTKVSSIGSGDSEGIYRSGTYFTQPLGRLWVGENQWVLRRRALGVDEKQQLSEGLSIELEESRFDVFSQLVGFVDCGNGNGLLYLDSHSGSLLCTVSQLPVGYIYQFTTWVYSVREESVVVSCDRGANVPIGVALTVNGTIVFGDRVHDSNSTASVLQSSVQVHAGWNRVSWYVIVWNTLSKSFELPLRLWSNTFRAYPQPFEVTSPYSLRYDSRKIGSHFAWYGEAREEEVNYYVEVGIPMTTTTLDKKSTDLPRVVLEQSDSAVTANKIQVMFIFSTSDNTRTPVLKEYLVEVMS